MTADKEKVKKKNKCQGTILFAILLLTGCEHLGPKTVTRDRFDYKTFNYGEHFIIDAEGNLRLWDSYGFIRKAIRKRGP